MKKFFFLCTMLLASVSMFAATETVEFTPANFSGQGKSGSGSACSATVSGVTVSSDKGFGAAQFRVYKNGNLTISSKHTITQVDLTTSSIDYTGGLEDSYTGLNTTSWTQKLTSQGRFLKIVVTYEKAAATEPTITTETEVKFGAAINAAGFKAQELEVTGELLTVVPTYNLTKGTAFAVNGTLTTTTGTLTITCTATEPGEYTDVLTITSGSASAEVALSATIVDVEGAGTKDSPLTPADVIKLNNRLGVDTTYWVQGYIIGAYKNGGTIDNAVNTNIILSTETELNAFDAAKCVIVSISDDARAALNIVDHSSFIGEQVKVNGTLEPFDGKHGVKNVKTAEQYELLFSLVAIQKITLPANATVEEGRKLTLTPTLEPANANGSITWTSSNADVATVKSGVVTALAIGKTIITATAGEGIVATCEVTVTENLPTPTTCAQAAEWALTVASNQKYDEGEYFLIRAYVSEWNYVHEKSGKWVFWLSDTKEGTNTIQVYLGTPIAGKEQLVEGEYVDVLGQISQYTPQGGTATPQIQNAAITLVPQTGTALENTTTEEVKARKVVENGQIFILKDGVKYNIFGAVVD